MKKIVILVVLMFFSIASYAQSEKIWTDTALVQRVDSLEHEITYLKLIYEIENTRSDIEIYTNETYIYALSIQLNILAKNVSREMGKAFEEDYERRISRMQSYSELIERKKEFVALNLIVFPFSYAERNLIQSNMEVLDSSLKKLDATLNMLKVSTEAYIGMMRKVSKF